MSVAGLRPGAGSLSGSRREPTLGGRRPPFAFPVSVYYEDTDAAGVVYYANYLKFMERARTEWLASLGFPLAEFVRTHGVAFVVHRVEVDFLAPARLNDRLDVTVEPLLREGSPAGRPDGEVERGAERADRSRVRFVALQEVRRGPVTLTRARVAVACVDTVRWKPARIPEPLQHALETAT